MAMSFKINDLNLINDITGQFIAIIDEQKKLYLDKNFEFPLDNEIINQLDKLKPSNELFPYSIANQLNDLWIKLIKKSITCLRFFDSREPFFNNPKKVPIAYGIDNIIEYHKKYTDFEGLLYGANAYYRDHIFHAIRVWMLGLFCLLKKVENQPLLIDSLEIDGIKDQSFIKDLNFFEKISMWTLAALCHDLGYPLEKAQQILDKTQSMMKEFIPAPSIWNNFVFNGSQDNINEYIVKFISSKMKEASDKDVKLQEEKFYLGRIQSKYYIKYAKSLEKYDHGIIGAVIVYKMLLYFIESDFNLNDDNLFDSKDARQFYIRREILRAIATHTCSDIYNVKLTTFSSLLFTCDELQEWGRKSWNDLYSGILPDTIKLTINRFCSGGIDVLEKIDMKTENDQKVFIQNIARIFKKQYSKYKLIFRDGQYTYQRKFDIKKKMLLSLGENGTDNNEVSIEYEINTKNVDCFRIDITDSVFIKQDLDQLLQDELKDSQYEYEIIDNKDKC